MEKAVKKKKRPNLKLIGEAGTFYVCAELATFGVIAAKAPENTPLFDIVATSQDGKDFANIQVKTKSSSHNRGWQVGKNFCRNIGSKNIFVILVSLRHGKTNGDPTEAPQFYVFEKKHIVDLVKKRCKKLAAQPKKNGEKRKDRRTFNFRRHDKIWVEKTLNRWEVLPFGIRPPKISKTKLKTIRETVLGKKRS